MGLILGALAGAAKGFEESYDDQRKERMAIEADQRRDASARGQALFSADLQDQRARALVLFKQEQDNQARVEMAKRIGGAAGEIADREVNKTRGIINQGMADPASWTAEQQAAVDQSLALDRQALMSDPSVRTQAAVETGDIDPRTAAGLDIRGKQAEAQARAQERKEQLTREQMEQRDRQEQARLEQREKESERRHGTTLAAINARGAREKDDSKLSREERLRYTTLFNSAGRQMAEAQKRLATLQRDPMYSTAPVGSPERAELDDIRASVSEYQKERQMYGSLLADPDKKPDAVQPEASARPEPPKAQQQPAAAPGQPVRVTSQAEHAKLPKGTRYVAPDGSIRVKN